MNATLLVDGNIFASFLTLVSSEDEGAALAALTCTGAIVSAVSDLGAAYSLTLIYSRL